MTAKKEKEKSKSAGASAAKTPEQPKAPAVEKKEAEKVAGSEKRRQLRRLKIKMLRKRKKSGR